MKKNTLVFHADFSAKKNGDGSVKSPWNSIPKAQKALRALRKEGKLDNADVRILCRGITRIDKPIVFSPEDGAPAGSKHTVTWAGDGSRAIIAGSRKLEGFTEGTINNVPCWKLDIPEVKEGKWKFTQLWVNGDRRLSARLPRGGGWYRFTGVPEEESKKDDHNTLFHGALAACFAPGECFDFANKEDIDVVIPDHWYDNHIRVASVDTKNNIIHFASKGYSRLSKDETGLTTRYRIDNVREGCLEPGDWYLDRHEGTLYYIPKPDEHIDKALIEAPVAETLLNVHGSLDDNKPHVHNLRFEYFEFRHTEWVCPSASYTRQASIHAIGSLLFTGAENCGLYACDIHGLAGYGVDIMRGSHDCRIIACAIHDLGGGGVKIGPENGLTPHWTEEISGNGSLDTDKLGWGKSFYSRPNKCRPSHTTVADCTIHDGGIIHHAAVGVWIGDAACNRIVHNDIYKFYYTGVSCGWHWGFAPAWAYDNRIEWNHIWDIGRSYLSDMGGIYTLGRQIGTTASYNFIHDVTSYGYGGWGLYTDEGSSWINLEHNVVLHTKSSSFHQHYGRDNILRHNLLADSFYEQIARVTRCMAARPVCFEQNICINPAYPGHDMWQSGHDLGRCKIDRNAYIARPDVKTGFQDGDLDTWRKRGLDKHGIVCEGTIFDTTGASPAFRIPKEATKLTGITAEGVAKVVNEAGPRYKGAIPETIDEIPLEPETKRPLVEVMLWPWDVEWPEDIWAKRMLNNGTVKFNSIPENDKPALLKGESSPVSLTLENRGDAPVKGEFTFKVIPAGAAVLDGPAKLPFSLKPGDRLAWRGTVTATGKAPKFQIEANASTDAVPSSAVCFDVPKEKPQEEKK